MLAPTEGDPHLFLYKNHYYTLLKACVIILFTLTLNSVNFQQSSCLFSKHKKKICIRDFKLSLSAWNSAELKSSLLIIFLPHVRFSVGKLKKFAEGNQGTTNNTDLIRVGVPRTNLRDDGRFHRRQPVKTWI